MQPSCPGQAPPGATFFLLLLKADPAPMTLPPAAQRLPSTLPPTREVPARGPRVGQADCELSLLSQAASPIDRENRHFPRLRYRLPLPMNSCEPARC